MKSSTRFVNKKQGASFRLVGYLTAIPLLWLMLAATNTFVYAQTSDRVSNSSTATASSPADWTQFHRDNMQRWNQYETVLGVNNVGSLKLKWKTAIGFTDSIMESSPAVANGVVYFGSADGNVYALNASTGAKLWSFATGGRVDASPAVANGVVYVGSTDNNMYALNASTGAKRWSFVSGDAASWYSSPAVVKRVVYFGATALNANTGAKLWSRAITGGASSPAVANGVDYVGSGYTMYALNASTGATLWNYAPNPEDTFRSPAVANGMVYVSSGEGCSYALNANTGQPAWRSSKGCGDSPAVMNGVAYVGGGAFALNASTGALLWTFDTSINGIGYDVLSSAAVANGVVYVTVNSGTVYALNASSGARLWSYDTGSSALMSSPTIVDGVLYVRAGGSADNVYAFSIGADLFLRIRPSTTIVHQDDLLTYAFPVWNLGPNNAVLEVLNTQVPAGTVFDYIRISGTPGLGTCTHPPYGGTGQIICHEGDGMAPNTTWTVRLTVKVTAAAGSTITADAATMADTPDPNMANNTATVSLKVQ